MQFKIVSLFYVVFCFSVFKNSFLLAKNSFLVAPTVTEIDLKKPSTKSFVVSNNGDERIRINVEPVYFSADSKFIDSGKQIDSGKDGKDSKDSLAEHIRVSPRTLSLEPGEQRHVRISVRPPSKLEEGEYRAHLLFKMLEYATPVRNEIQGAKGLSMKLNFKLETAVAVYGTIGERQPIIELECLIDKNKTIKILARNYSKWRFDGQVKIFPVSDTNKIIKAEKIFLIRQTEKTFLVDIENIDINDKIRIVLETIDTKQIAGKSDCKPFEN